MTMNVQKQCIFCGSVSNLNTAMGISLDDEAKTKISVLICDQCSDDATPKRAREAYLKKQIQIDEVLAQARALGIELSAPGSTGLIIATGPIDQPQLQPITQSVASRRPTPLIGVSPILEGEDVVSTSIIDKRSMVSIGGPTQMGNNVVNVQSHASYDTKSLESQLPDNMRQGQVKLQWVEGRGGKPIQIPALRSDRMGMTRVRIVKSNDSDLQQRARRLVDQSNQIEGWKRPSFIDGYMIENTERSCALCNGDGAVVNDGRSQLCPKCNGVGIT